MEVNLNAENIISQQILRQVESLCTQEDLPACSAACPLHLDARTMLGLVSEGKWEEAYKLYAKTLPFSSILAHSCNAPCQTVCKRETLGGAVQIQGIEETLVRLFGTAPKPPFMLPKKTSEAAIVGGGLRGLAAANDLLRKGYKVTIFEASESLGGVLTQGQGSETLRELLDREVACLLEMPLTINYNKSIAVEDNKALKELLQQGFSAVFVACESPMDEMADGETLATPTEGVVAGRRAGRISSGHSTVYDVFDGRSAATTMDRIMQKVSVSAGREKEGSKDTQLYTDLASVVFETAAQVDKMGLSKQQAEQEAARCIQCECMECVKKCAFLQHYKGSPRRYVREVYNNLSIAMGSHDANTMINNCALCGQCEAVCPNGLDLAAVFTTARQRMVQTKKMPASTHEFALLDMENSFSDNFYLARHPKGKQSSECVFFPGCQLAALQPDLVKRVYTHLGESKSTGLWLACCGVMAQWAGNKQKLAEAKEKLLQDWEKLGKPLVVAGCPTCAVALNELYGINSQYIAQTLLEEDFNVAETKIPPAKMVLHHACGARYNSEMQQSVYELATRTGIELEQGTPKDQSPCCGYGGLVSLVSSSMANEITEVALGQMQTDEHLPYLTYCANCTDRFSSENQSASHLLEILFPAEKEKIHKSPTWFLRQQNRSQLRSDVLRELWDEETQRRQQVKLFIDAELEGKLDEAHILQSDLATVIEEAEKTQNKFQNPKTHHYSASFRPANVTFWVEYLPEADGFRVINAYSHRMAVTLTSEMGRPSEENQ